MGIIKLKYFIKSLCFALLACLALGCSDSRHGPGTDYDRASSLMDAGQYSSAIQIMDGRLMHDPSDKRARTLLAAAYAGRAGIFISDFFDLAGHLSVATSGSAPSATDPSLVAIADLKKRASSNTQKSALNILEKIYTALIRLNNVLKVFDLIPSIQSSANLQDLNSAISTLAADNTLVGGAAMYRGLLRTVKFKYDINDSAWFKISDGCQINLPSARNKLAQLQKSTSLILNDFLVGTVKPSRKKSISESINSLDKVFAEALDVVTYASNDNSIDISVVKNRLGGKCP